MPRYIRVSLHQIGAASMRQIAFQDPVKRLFLNSISMLGGSPTHGCCVWAEAKAICQAKLLYAANCQVANRPLHLWG